MPAAVLEPDSLDMPAGRQAGRGDFARLRPQVIRSFAEAKALWRQAASGHHLTPYQDFNWLDAYSRLVDGPAGRAPLVVALSAATGTPLLILPLAVERKGGLRIARFVGGKHANFNMPVCAPDAAALGESVLRDALIRAGAEAGIDLFAFANQPRDWEGFANPLAALGGQASPSAGYKLALAHDGEALLKERLSKDARKKLRQKETKLAQIGPITHVRPESPADVRALLADFLRLKAARFQSQGITDPFDGDDIRAFLDAVATGEGAGGRSLELHALTVGGKTVAIYGALTDATRFCGLFTAFDADPEIARSSPGDILLMKIIADACRRGLRTFDLGVGEARYKAQVCDQTEPLFDTLLPVTAKGRLAGLLIGYAGAAKRRLKQSALASRVIAQMRRLKARRAD